MNSDLIIDSIWFKNIQSYGANVTKVKLNIPGTTIIEGVNMDNGTDGKGANGVGKAQPLYSKILTPSGWTTMGEIEAGDEVITPCGNVAKVIGTFPQPGLRKVYKVTFEDGRSTDVDEDHLWTVAPTAWEAGTWNHKQVDMTTGEILATAQLSGKPINLFVPNVTNAINKLNIGADIDCFHVGIKLESIERSDNFYRQLEEQMDPAQRMQLILGALSFSVDVGEDASLIYRTDSDQIRTFLTNVIRSVGGRARIEDENIYIHLPTFDRVIKQLPLSQYKVMKATANERHRQHGLKIESIELVSDDQRTKCILIDHPSRLYVTDNYIATHNTTIGTALSLALFGKPLDSKTKLDDLVNNINKKNMEVGCTFHIGNDAYTIRRTRKSKAGAAGNTVTIWKHNLDGSDKKDITPDSVDQCNVFMENLIGIPYDIFNRIVIFSATHVPFLSLPARSQHGLNQSDMIEHLFGLTALTEYADTLKSLNDTDVIELQTKQRIVQTLEAERAKHQKAIENTQVKLINWESDQATRISQLEAKISRASEISIDEQLALYAELHKVQGVISELKLTAQSTQRQVDRKVKEHTKIQGELKHLADDKCPFCLQKFEDSASKQDELRSAVETLEAELLQLNDTSEVSSAALLEVDATRAEIESKIVISESELKALSKSASSLNIELSVLKEQTNPFIAVLDELESYSPDDIDYKSIDELNKTIEHRKFLIKLFTKRDSFVRKRLLDRFIPYLNERLANNLTLLGLPHKVEFQHDMTVKITSFGRDLGFDLLSAGQKARVNIALAWAFRDVYQKRYRRVNLSMLDEILDIGLDSMGVQAAVKLLKHKSRTDKISMFIISHRTDDVGNAFDRKIQVIMEGGFSRVEDNNDDGKLDDVEDLDDAGIAEE